MSKAFLTGESALSRPRYLCHADNCVLRVTRASAAEMFCERHWHLLPSDLQTLLGRKFWPKRVSEASWSQPFARFMHQAQRELAYIERNGHQIPKPADFMWDDP